MMSEHAPEREDSQQSGDTPSSSRMPWDEQRWARAHFARARRGEFQREFQRGGIPPARTPRRPLPLTGPAVDWPASQTRNLWHIFLRNLHDFPGALVNKLVPEHNVDCFLFEIQLTPNMPSQWGYTERQQSWSEVEPGDLTEGDKAWLVEQVERGIWDLHERGYISLRLEMDDCYESLKIRWPVRLSTNDYFERVKYMLRSLPLEDRSIELIRSIYIRSHDT